MSYRRVLLGRWSRRDRLTVVVVALGVAFVCGTALVVVVAGAQTTALAAEYGATATVTTHDSVGAATAAAPPGATVLPYAVVGGPDGRSRYVLARPADTGSETPDAVTAIAEGTGTTLGSLGGSTEHTLRGEAGTVTVSITPRGTPPLPPRWYVAERGTVEELGTTGAFVVRAVPEGTVPRTGVPLRTALVFFSLGTRQALAALSTVVAGAGLLLGVVVYSVTRMTVRDRERTVRVVRATGGTGRTVLALFAARAGGLAATGSALGYAVGVIGVHAAVNAAVFAGLPTSLSPRVTADAAAIMVPVLVGTTLVGVLAGGLAAWPVARRPPFATRSGARTRRSTAGDTEGTGSPFARVRALATPTLLDPRTVVPTTATLSVFVAFVVLVAAMGGVLAPISGTEGATITEPGATHPVASNVPATYADALRDRDIDASAELLLFEADDGRPYTLRGANYSAFASVTDATLTRGRRPADPGEAVVGADLASTLGVGVGSNLTLGGLTRDGLSRVRIVGVFDAPGPYDDQLVVPLATAQHLANRPPGTAQFVRAERLPTDALSGPSVTVLDVRVPESVPADGTVTVTAVVRNDRDERVNATIEAELGSESVERRVRLDPGETGRVRFTLPTGAPGRTTLTVGGITREVPVGDAGGAGTGGLSIGPLPDRGPPNATLLVTVSDPGGGPVANATVTAGAATTATGNDGVAAVSTGAPGRLTVDARAGNRSATESLAVEVGAPRRPAATLSVAPSEPDLLARPTLTARLANPWNRTLRNVSVTLAGPDRSVRRVVTLGPGEARTVSLRLPRRPPGRYEATVVVDGEQLDATRYRVTGDERVAAAVAAGGRTGSSGIGRAIETAFGNLRLVLGVVLGLAAALTVGGTTAAFARAVHGRRETVGVYRATGASPGRVARVVLGDAVRIGTGATLLAVPLGLGGLRVAAAAGYLTVFGVRLRPAASPGLLVGVALAGVALATLGAGIAVASMLLASPATLLGGESLGTPDDGEVDA